jgi:hypothetical protein
LESIGEPGGVTVSGTVFDQVKNRIQLGFDFIGERRRGCGRGVGCSGGSLFIPPRCRLRPLNFAPKMPHALNGRFTRTADIINRDGSGVRDRR